MPLQTQISLSLELAKVFPIREVISSGVEKLANLVRALKRDGSDFLVEEDLADIFGRGKIEPSLEKDFRDVVKTGSMQPLHADSPISLDTGPGATVRRALRDRFYMSSVIQLSFLVEMHEETTLAAALVENMLKRYESKVHGATPDPDYEGILKTLQACSSQTSQYRWENLASDVQNRFPNSTKWFCVNSSPLRSLSPNVLLGAMDYLYMVQSLPEDRVIMVENQKGLVPIVIWAHYILGLTVLIKNSPDGDVAFGFMEDPQVIIKWSTTLLPTQAFTTRSFFKHSHHPALPPTIYLLDADMHVLLRTEPEDNETIKIDGQECHRLKGYGTTFLRRFFNVRTFSTDDDPIFAETANFVVSYAVLLSRLMQRAPFSREDDILAGNKHDDVADQCSLSTENWRLFSSSTLFFWEIKLDKRKISEYLDRLSGKCIKDMPIPTSIRNYLEKSEEDSFETLKEEFFDNNINQLAVWILAFAQIVDIESCADLPLWFAPGKIILSDMIRWNGMDSVNIEAFGFFNLVMFLMRSGTMATASRNMSEQLFLTCHRGWSLFYSSIGDYDPEEMNCELLCIKQGVPTNTQTGERKYRIADAPHVDQEDNIPRIIERESSYLPRCVTKVSKRTERYSSRSNEFWLSIRFDIEEQDLHCQTPARETRQNLRYSLFASYSQFHRAFWGVVKTIPCRHRNANGESLSLDLDAMTFAGLIWAYDQIQEKKPRICICLVKGDARARWLVINGSIDIHNCIASDRRIMLRCDGCCADCSVKAASAMKGDWLVVL